MKKQFLLLISIILYLNSFAQIKFEKGYFIDNNNQKTTCLIKNIDWRNNPSEFVYKLSENSETEKATANSVMEFKIDNDAKFISRTVNIDRSREDINELSTERKPVFKEETLFLKVLVEGKANLYYYLDGDIKRFFYNNENTNIEQLVFKTYKNNKNVIVRNEEFKRQLWLHVKCPDAIMSTVEKLEYKKKDLIKYFMDYSQCHNNDFEILQSGQKRKILNLSLRPRIGISSLMINNVVNDIRDTEIENTITVGIGLEAEFVFGFNKNKWSFLIEPTYQRYRAEKTTPSPFLSGGAFITDVNYSSIEIPLSLRHYFFLNDDSKIYVNVSYFFDVNLNSSIMHRTPSGTTQTNIDINTNVNLGLGLGYKLRNKIGVELRYEFPRDIVSQLQEWDANYSSLSLIFGYTI